MRVLYLTYDGLTSLIGQSQVWPYLKGLAEAGHRLEVLSFEQSDRIDRIGERVGRELSGAGIRWHPCRFRTRPPMLAKILDQREMAAKADRLIAGGGFDLVHARSYVAADAALALKERYGLRFLFDMRGFWADQRREGGRWPASNPFYRRLFARWKGKEASFVAASSHVVVLAETARRIIQSWPSYRGQPVSVIPCCIDHSKFTPRTSAERAASRARLGIPQDATVLAYLGSLGTVYLLPAMMRFFARLRRRRPGAIFVFIGRNNAGELVAAARSAGVELATDELRTCFAEHGEVNAALAAADMAICFIMPTFSSLGVSPTKLAEYLACGLPVVVNEGVGDVGDIVRRLDAGTVLTDLGDAAMDDALADLDRLLGADPRALAERSRALHDMSVALARYREVYDSLSVRRPEPVR